LLSPVKPVFCVNAPVPEALLELGNVTAKLVVKDNHVDARKTNWYAQTCVHECGEIM